MARVNLEQFKERLEKGKVIPALLLLGDRAIPPGCLPRRTNR